MKLPNWIKKVVAIAGKILDIAALISPKYHELKKKYSILGAALNKVKKLHPTDRSAELSGLVHRIADQFGLKDKINDELDGLAAGVDKKLKKIGISLDSIKLPF